MIVRLLLSITALLICLGASCPQGRPTNVCRTEETRCNPDENQAEVCDARGRWQVIIDCTEIDADRPFTCQRTDTGEFACLPGER